MLKKTHISVGMVIVGVLTHLFGITFGFLGLAAATIGTIFPDIDHPEGSINNSILIIKNNLFKLITYIFFTALILKFGPKYIDIKIVLGIAALFVAIGFSKHRGITHSIPGIIGMCILLNFIRIKYNIDILIPFVLGMITHIMLDMCNPKGCQLLYPYKKYYKFPVISITTGGNEEKILCSVFCVGVLIFFYKSFNVNNILLMIKNILKVR